VRLFKTLWGHEGTVAEAVTLAKEAGFEGVEAPVPMAEDERVTFFQELGDSGLDWISEVSTCTPEGKYVPLPGRSAEEHLESLENGLVRSLEGRPRMVNVMGGWDGWNFDEALKFHEGVLALEERYEVPISVETHRGRFSVSPWLMRDVLARLPDLRLTCDFSHWCVVSERLLLDEEPGILALAARHAYHVHARVGYAQGAQVPDPRAPEYLEELAAHERWWDALSVAMAGRGFEEMTMTPEAGPDGYLQEAPFTRVPVADLWEVNRWMGQRQKKMLEAKVR
jgi:sugar phosphate isomerase/epimerase